jgi:hypothetical protein
VQPTRPARSAALGLLLILTTPLSSGCIRKTIDNVTLKRVVPTALAVGDVDRTCKIGEVLGHPLAALPSQDNPPDAALIIADAVAALCDEARAWEAEIDSVTAQTIVPVGPGRIAAVKDARAREARYRSRSALRDYSAWQRANRHFGELGTEDTCPAIRRKDEIAYLVGLVAGTLGMLNDKASGGHVGIPLDTASRVGRAAPCLDDATWWHVPTALQAASWVAVPGSGPEDVDAWQALKDAAIEGEKSGVRIGWALYTKLAGNSGDDARLREGITAMAASLESTPRAEEWAMLDEYARTVVLHESDLLWARERGHRTPTLGDLPVDESAAPEPADDPFAEDPFGADPFAAPAEDAPEEDAPEEDAPAGEDAP